MYGKIFASIYDGTLAENWQALVTFQQMIILCDQDGMIDMTAASISRRTGIPLDHIEAGIKALQAPDKNSRTEGEAGRRIMLIDEHRDWGWHIINHEKYLKLKDMATVREQTKERVRLHRERKKGKAVCNVTVTDGNACNVTVTDGNAVKRHIDIDKDINIKHLSKSDDLNFDLFWKNYPRKDNKKKAEIAFKSLTLKKQLKAIDDCKTRYVAVEKKYMPLPTTYLHGERWEDAMQSNNAFDDSSFGAGGI